MIVCVIERKCNIVATRNTHKDVAQHTVPEAAEETTMSGLQWREWFKWTDKETTVLDKIQHKTHTSLPAGGDDHE